MTLPPIISCCDYLSPMVPRSSGARYAHMTNDRFRELCEQILIPRLGDFMHHQLIELHRSFDELEMEVARIGRRVDWIAGQLSIRNKHEDHR